MYEGGFYGELVILRLETEERESDPISTVSIFDSEEIENEVTF